MVSSLIIQVNMLVFNVNGRPYIDIEAAGLHQLTYVTRN